MKDSPYNKMFSVSKEKTLIKNLETGEITGYRHVKTGYDLSNYSVYDTDGNLISEENQIKYNSVFLLEIAHLKIVEVRNFLNYHLERTPDQLAFIDYVQFGIANAKVIHASTKAAIENWAVEVRSSNSKNSNKFRYFDLYFSAVNQLLFFSEVTLHKTKDLTVEYFTITRDYESKNKLYSSEFQNEIRNNVTDFERQDKIKIYLEQIQTALNRVYDFVESKNEVECNGKLRFHSSIVSVQNLCRDIAIKNNIDIAGDSISKIVLAKVKNEPVKAVLGSSRPTLKGLALYYHYKGIKVTKENAKELLKGTNLNAVVKLKSFYDQFQSTKERIGAGSERANGAKLRLFEAVIERLRAESETEALSKAEIDLSKFEKNIA